MSEFQASNLKKAQGGSAPNLVGKVEFTSPYFFVPPSGDTASRPQSCASGTIRFNTDVGTLEVYRGDTIGWEYIVKQPSAPIGTRGLVSGTQQPARTNVIDFITVATTGNASDFGDMLTTGAYRGMTSDSHGGLE